MCGAIENFDCCRGRNIKVRYYMNLRPLYHRKLRKALRFKVCSRCNDCMYTMYSTESQYNIGPTLSASNATILFRTGWVCRRARNQTRSEGVLDQCRDHYAVYLSSPQKRISTQQIVSLLQKELLICIENNPRDVSDV